ncbi:MAG: sodium:proton antiporter [Ignavibacteriales bacterium]|nr:sodium:proton antiporter [Ignavibacteriales bacterium]
MLRRISLVAVLLCSVSSLTWAQSEVTILPVSPVMILPFVLFLAAIALMPFFQKKWWEQNYPAVSFSLGALVVVYYLFAIHNAPRLLVTLHEYISFIVLIGSLFVVSGGIHFRLRGKATPLANVALLACGAIISNLVGTTGASMLLIRPYIRVNKYRIRAHHVVFFIFIVSNAGGALTPIGDPPLFLGYLKGVPFFWVLTKTWIAWLFVIVSLLGMFAILDYRQYRHLTKHVQHEVERAGEEPRVEGLANLGFLLAILIGVFIQDPIGVREFIMIAAAIGSYYTTAKSVHTKNDFNFQPIREVAILFVGIFATMIPALDWLTLNSRTLGLETPAQFYWGSGLLSSFLDNAPTYLNFLTAAFGLHGMSVENPAHMTAFLNDHWQFVQAVSLGSVFFGACTYIGNGPNFMVKSIAEQSGVAMPTFFGYIVKFTLVYLLPIYGVVWFLFFRI